MLASKFKYVGNRGIDEKRKMGKNRRPKKKGTTVKENEKGRRIYNIPSAMAVEKHWGNKCWGTLAVTTEKMLQDKIDKTS